MPPPKFLYFDLGNVVLNFDHRRMCRQMAEVAGIEPDAVWSLLFDTPLERQLELGEITNEQFYESFCRETGTRPDYAVLQQAGNDIFRLNTPVVAIVAMLQRAGCRLGLLSNTSEAHYAFFGLGRYAIVAEAFPIVVLSCRVRAMKPDPAIYRYAAEQAGVEPGEIFFVDDVAGHVEGARSFGFDAVQYTSADQLARDLRARGLPLNY